MLPVLLCFWEALAADTKPELPGPLGITNAINGKTEFRIFRRQASNNYWDTGNAYSRSNGIAFVRALQDAQPWDSKSHAIAPGILRAYEPGIRITIDWSPTTSQPNTHSVALCYGNRLFWYRTSIYQVPESSYELMDRLFPADSLFALSISIPLGRDGIRHLQQQTPPPSRFQVVISNTTDKIQRVWSESCSWGYAALSFELTDETGKITLAKKRDVVWTVNFPKWHSLDPGKSLGLDVKFADTNLWMGFPRPEHRERTVSMRAVFATRPDGESRTHGVWAGCIVSDALKVTVHPWQPEKK